VKESQRVPGYPMRYIGAKKIDEDLEQTMENYNVDGDGERGIPIRTAKPKDVEQIGVKRKPSPLV
jgi:hypothetical protein